MERGIRREGEDIRAEWDRHVRGMVEKMLIGKGHWVGVHVWGLGSLGAEVRKTQESMNIMRLGCLRSSLSSFRVDLIYLEMLVVLG
jgi:hypothetical protein